MQITKTSKMTGIEHTREIAITPDQMARWKAGAYIQDVCPHLSPDDREFLISGTMPEEWEAAFGVGDGDEERGWIVGEDEDPREDA